MHFFLPKKVDNLFLVVILKDRLNIPPNLTRPAKNCPKKLTLALAGGALRVLGGALTHFYCKLPFTPEKIFFHRPGGAGAPTAPLATPMLLLSPKICMPVCPDAGY